VRIPAQQQKRIRRLIRALEKWGEACTEHGHSSEQAKVAAARALPMCAAQSPVIRKVVKPPRRLPTQAFHRIDVLAEKHAKGHDLSGYWTAYQDLLWPRIGDSRTLIDTLKEALEK
jgi:hypothetical protein